MAIIDELRKGSTKKLLEQEKIQETAKTLRQTIEDLPDDSDGCVVYEVQYEHRNPSFCGQLYAKGKMVCMS